MLLVHNILTKKKEYSYKHYIAPDFHLHKRQAIRLKKPRVALSSNSRRNQSRHARTRFLALRVSYMPLLRVLIGSLDCLDSL